MRGRVGQEAEVGWGERWENSRTLTFGRPHFTVCAHFSSFDTLVSGEESEAGGLGSWGAGGSPRGGREGLGAPGPSGSARCGRARRGWARGAVGAGRAAAAGGERRAPPAHAAPGRGPSARGAAAAARGRLQPQIPERSAGMAATSAPSPTAS